MERKINRYFNYLGTLLESAKEINAPTHAPLFRASIYLSILDTQSKCRFPELKGNGNRFKRFVIEYSDWLDAEKISVPQLYYYLKKGNSEEYTLKAFLESKMQWIIGDVVSISNDVSANTICAISKQKNVWEKFQHVDLLWKYRNSISHEVRKLGYGISLSDDEVPFYHTEEHFDSRGVSKGDYWELVYPERFLYEITKKSLSNLRGWCIDNAYNPYDSHTFGTLWVK